MKIKLIKFRDDLIKPVRAHYNDAGIDCYAQEDFELYPAVKFDSKCLRLQLDYDNDNNLKNVSMQKYADCCDPFESGMPKNDETLKFEQENVSIKIPLGFGLEIPDGYMAIIKPRSSMNLKGIITYEGIIDSGFRGEICAAFTNLIGYSHEFHRGDKICQIVIEPVVLADLVEDLGDERGSGGFGSTGK